MGTKQMKIISGGKIVIYINIELKEDEIFEYIGESGETIKVNTLEQSIWNWRP